MTPRTDAEDYRNVEVSKIEGLGTVRRNPEEGQAGPERKGKSAAGESGTRGAPAGPPSSQRGCRQESRRGGRRRESSRQEKKAIAFAPGSPTHVTTEKRNHYDGAIRNHTLCFSLHPALPHKPLNVRFGSKADSLRLPSECPLLGVKRTCNAVSKTDFKFPPYFVKTGHQGCREISDF